MKKWLLYTVLTITLVVIGATAMNVYAKNKTKELEKKNTIQTVKKEEKEKKENNEEVIIKEEIDTSKKESKEEEIKTNEIETSKGYLNIDAITTNTNEFGTVSSSINPDDLTTSIR